MAQEFALSDMPEHANGPAEAIFDSAAIYR